MLTKLTEFKWLGIWSDGQVLCWIRRPSCSDCDCLLAYVLLYDSSSYEEAQQQFAFTLPALCLPRSVQYKY